MFIWTISDAVAVIVFAVIGIFLLYLWASTAIRQARCKHDGSVGETRECDAICDQCGKNLGFIGLRREKTRKFLC